MEGKDKYVLEYLDLCLKYTNSFTSTEVKDAEVTQIIKRIHELRYALGMEPICLGGIKGKSLTTEKETEDTKNLEAPIKQAIQKDKVTSNELNIAEQALEKLFRRAYAPTVDNNERAVLVSGLSTFGRLIEKEKHTPDIATTVAIIRLSVGLYDGSLDIDLTSETENRIEADIFDTIHRIKTGHISIGRMGRTCYIREIDFKFL